MNILLRILPVALALGCVSAPAGAPVPPSSTPIPGEAVDEVERVASLDAPLTMEEERWVEETVARLPLRRKVAQLVMPRISGRHMAFDDAQYERVRAWVEDLGIGGVIISIGPPLSHAVKLNTFQRMADVPLLVTADVEHGPGQILNGGTILPYGFDNGGGTRFPPLMALAATGDERFAWELGRVTAIEARAAGVHVAFAPVADVNNNPRNPIINTRSYGAGAEAVARFVEAHVRGLQDHGMIATAKHFPGHGDTGTDSHIELPFIYATPERVDSLELVPFRAALDAGAGAVMTAHIAFPALSGDSVPATLNDRILRPLLRENLGFDGLVFTDALDMGAIVRIYGKSRPPVMALQAGADILLQPLPNAVELLIESVTDAVHAGELSEERIDESLRRLLRAKAKLGLHRNAVVDVEAVPASLGLRRHQRIAAEAAQRSITAVRNDAGVLPLRAQRVLSIVYTDDRDPLAGRAFQAELSARLPHVRTALISGASEAGQLEELRNAADSVDVVLFSPFIRVRAGKTDLAIAPRVAELITDLQARRPLVVTAFGNPYLLAQFPSIETYVLAWADWEPLQTAAARALTGAEPITGRLPIPIPPYHEVGDGVDVDPSLNPASR